MTISESAREAFALLRSGQIGTFTNKALGRVYKEWRAYGLRRDLASPLPFPRAKIPLNIRELTPDDLAAFFPSDTTGLKIAQVRDLRVRQEMLAAGIGRCYIAVDELHDKPCYMQWLIGPAENPCIAEVFKGRFPPLKADEALLEGAYTAPEYRGQRVMAEGIARIAELGSRLGVRFVNTFVDSDNIASLKGCVRAGFEPFLLRRDRVLFTSSARRVTFEPFSGEVDWLGQNPIDGTAKARAPV